MCLTLLSLGLSVLPVHLLYKYKMLLIAYKNYKTPLHYDYLHVPHASQNNLESPSSTTPAGHRRMSYQCAFLWKGLPSFFLNKTQPYELSHSD